MGRDLYINGHDECGHLSRRSILIDSGLAEDTAIEALLAQGIKQKIIDTVLARVKATEFKRRMPDYKSLTNNCFIPDLFNGAFSEEKLCKQHLCLSTYRVPVMPSAHFAFLNSLEVMSIIHKDY